MASSKQRTTSRTRIRLTREGWIFLTIILFISVGAVLRNINLLIVLSGMMIAPLMLGWRLCVRTLSDLDIKRNLPPWVHARQRFDVEWRCTNQRRKLPTWCLNLIDHLRSSPDQPIKKSAAVQSIIPQIDPEKTEYATYRCMFPKRGLYHFGPTYVSTRFPMGLVSGNFRHIENVEIYVAPALGKLTPTWDRRLQSDASGTRAAKRRRGSEEDEFYALRPWRSGDSRRQIHWRSTAKHGEPIIKQFDQKSDRDFALVVDLYAPSQNSETQQIVDPTEQDRVEKALCFSATIFSQLKNAIQGRVSIAICGQETFSLCEPNNRELVSVVMQNLAIAEGAGNNELGEGLKRAYSDISVGTPVIVISTRPKPDSLGSLLELGNHSSKHVVEKWTRWIEVDSPEFDALFQMSNSVHSKLNSEQQEPVHATN